MNSAVTKEPIEAAVVDTSKRSASRMPVVRDSSPSGMIEYAMKTGASISELKELYELKKLWEADEARKAYNLAMTAFKAEEGLTILKRKRVSFPTKDANGNVNGETSYSHAELSDITEVVGPAMAKHELSFSWNVRQENALVYVDCITKHAQGHTETVTMFANPDNSGKKNGIQQIASTVTYLQRYTLLAATGMSTKGMDDDGRTAGDDPPAPPAPEPEESPELKKLVADLYSVADEGIEPLQKAWTELGAEKRKMVGSVRFAGIKARAEQRAAGERA